MLRKRRWDIVAEINLIELYLNELKSTITQDAL